MVEVIESTIKMKIGKKISIPKIEDYRGNLSVIEKEVIPFKMKRVYYLYNVPSWAERAGHAHKEQKAFLIALSGSFEVVLNNIKEKETIILNKPSEGLLIENGIWRELKNFSSGAVCLVIASDVFEEEDYIRDFEVYKDYIVNGKL